MCVFSVAVHKCSPTLEDENIQVALISMHLGVLNPSRSKKSQHCCMCERAVVLKKGFATLTQILNVLEMFVLNHLWHLLLANMTVSSAS